MERAANDNTPYRLSDILPLAFPAGGMTVSGLRREAARGRLQIMRIAGKDFTTLQDIEEMKSRCRAPANPQDYGCVPEAGTAPQHTLSSTAENSSALDAALTLCRRLKQRSPNTTRAAT